VDISIENRTKYLYLKNISFQPSVTIICKESVPYKFSIIQNYEKNEIEISYNDLSIPLQIEDSVITESAFSAMLTEIEKGNFSFEIGGEANIYPLLKYYGYVDIGSNEISLSEISNDSRLENVYFQVSGVLKFEFEANYNEIGTTLKGSSDELVKILANGKYSGKIFNELDSAIGDLALKNKSINFGKNYLWRNVLSKGGSALKNGGRIFNLGSKYVAPLLRVGNTFLMFESLFSGPIGGDMTDNWWPVLESNDIYKYYATLYVTSIEQEYESNRFRFVNTNFNPNSDFRLVFVSNNQFVDDFSVSSNSNGQISQWFYLNSKHTTVNNVFLIYKKPIITNDSNQFKSSLDIYAQSLEPYNPNSQSVTRENQSDIDDCSSRGFSNCESHNDSSNNVSPHPAPVPNQPIIRSCQYDGQTGVVLKFVSGICDIAKNSRQFNEITSYGNISQVQINGVDARVRIFNDVSLRGSFVEINRTSSANLGGIGGISRSVEVHYLTPDEKCTDTGPVVPGLCVYKSSQSVFIPVTSPEKVYYDLERDWGIENTLDEACALGIKEANFKIHSGAEVQLEPEDGKIKCETLGKGRYREFWVKGLPNIPVPTNTPIRVQVVSTSTPTNQRYQRSPADVTATVIARNTRMNEKLDSLKKDNQTPAATYPLTFTPTPASTSEFLPTSVSTPVQRSTPTPTLYFQNDNTRPILQQTECGIVTIKFSEPSLSGFSRFVAPGVYDSDYIKSLMGEPTIIYWDVPKGVTAIWHDSSNYPITEGVGPRVNEPIGNIEFPARLELSCTNSSGSSNDAGNSNSGIGTAPVQQVEVLGSTNASYRNTGGKVYRFIDERCEVSDFAKSRPITFKQHPNSSECLVLEDGFYDIRNLGEFANRVLQNETIYMWYGNTGSFALKDQDMSRAEGCYLFHNGDSGIDVERIAVPIEFLDVFNDNYGSNSRCYRPNKQD